MGGCLSLVLLILPLLPMQGGLRSWRDSEMSDSAMLIARENREYGREKEKARGRLKRLRGLLPLVFVLRDPKVPGRLLYFIHIKSLTIFKVFRPLDLVDLPHKVNNRL